MPKFGRFTFGEKEPAETYEGGYMERDKDFVNIFEGDPPGVLSSFEQPNRLIAAIHLDKGQSVREIKDA